MLQHAACSSAPQVEGNAVVVQGQSFHFEWLRERCQTADHCVDEETLQQKRNPHEFEAPVTERRGAQSCLTRVRDGSKRIFKCCNLL